MSERAVDRRQFIAGAAAAAAVATLTPTSAQAAEAPMTADAYAGLTWSFEVAPEPMPEDAIANTITDEVIVIGSGVAGLMTAASVVGHGGKCTLFSAGSKAVSRGGSNHAVGSKTQARLGIDYTPESAAAFFNNEISRQGYRVDSRKYWKFVNNSGEAMDWVTDIMEEAGYQTTLELPYVDPAGTFSIPSGAHNFYGPEITNSANEGEPLLTATLERYILDKGGSITYNMRACYLEREDNNTGRVTSVIAQDADGGYTRYVGEKAIVMATGDFSGDADLMACYCSAFADYVGPQAGDYDVEFRFGGLMPGDGQKMGLWIGAAWQNTVPNAPMIGWYGFPSPQSDRNHPGILLNVEGERFMNEDTSSVYAGYAVSGQTDRKVFTVWDSDFAYRFDTWESLGNNMDNLGIVPVSSQEKAAEFESGAEGGTYVKGDTIEEVLAQLAEQGGIDVEAAKATIERYNADVAAGCDSEYHKVQETRFPSRMGPSTGSTTSLAAASSSACWAACARVRTARFAMLLTSLFPACITWAA